MGFCSGLFLLAAEERPLPEVFRGAPFPLEVFFRVELVFFGVAAMVSSFPGNRLKRALVVIITQYI
jgi:hypothetical protein